MVSDILGFLFLMASGWVLNLIPIPTQQGHAIFLHLYTQKIVTKDS